METITIKPLDQPASRIALGTWAIGGWLWGGTDEQDSIKTIHKALDKGINVIDTAPVYGFGKSEELVGKAIAEYGHRDKIIIATKVALEWKENKIRRNSSDKRITKELEDSLRRLRTDYIDIYQIHWPDYNTPFEQTADVMLRLFQAGKIRAIGVSNYNVADMQRFMKIAPIHTTQPPYNIFEREIEETILPFTEKKGIVTLAYGALCRGLLSGRMRKETTFTGDDIRKNDPKFQSPRYENYLQAVQALNDFAQKHYDRNVLELAVRWVLDKGHTVALWGARRPEQLDPVEKVLNWHIDEDGMEEINKIVDTITNPVGPGFMAPPTNASA